MLFCIIVERKTRRFFPSIASAIPDHWSYTVLPTYRPHKKKRHRKIGFLARMSTPGGKNVLRRRRRKGRHTLIVA